MQRIVAVAVLATLSVACGGPEPAANSSPAVPAAPSETVLSLVEHERGFAATSAEQGIRAAFLQWLGEGSTVFQPGPVDARSWYDALPEREGTLDWAPVFAEVSSSGLIGYTTGPWVFRAGESEAHGHYVSIWTKDESGGWKVKVDLGVTHPEIPAPELVTRDPTEGESRGAATANRILQAEEALSRALATGGGAAAYANHAVESVRVYREGQPPVTGRPGAGTDRRVRFAAEGQGVSGSLGYSFGLVRSLDDETATAETGYLHIWRRGDDGRWRLALDIEVPV